MEKISEHAYDKILENHLSFVSNSMHHLRFKLFQTDKYRVYAQS